MGVIDIDWRNWARAMATETVLIIDDNKLVRETVARMASGKHRLVLQVADGPAGLDIVEREHVDVVMCDLHMPGRTGYEIVDELRRKYPTLKIIVMSGSGKEDLQDVAQRIGADFFLTKPFRRDKCIAILQSCFEATKS